MDERHIGREIKMVYHSFIVFVANIVAVDHSRAREGIFILQHFDLRFNLAMSRQHGNPRRANLGHAKS